MKRFLAFIITFCASLLIVMTGFIAQAAYVYGPKEFFRLDNGEPTTFLTGSTGVIIGSILVYWFISMMSLLPHPEEN